VTLQCAIPGASPYAVDDGTSARDDHGICGADSTSFVSDSTGAGFETIGGVIQRNRPIDNVRFGAANPTEYRPNMSAGSSTVSGTGTYFATWTSYDNANHTGAYNHYGRAIVTNIDNAHPNRS